MSSEDFPKGVPAPIGVAPYPYALTEDQEFTDSQLSSTHNLGEDSGSNSATQVDKEDHIDLEKNQIAKTVDEKPAHHQHREPPMRRWIVLGVATLGGFLVSLQSSALIVALPDLMQNLNITFETIIWVLLAFSLSITAIVPVLGYLGDSGIKGVRCMLFNFGFLIFTIGSFLCGWSQPHYDGYDLVGYRTIQGLGGALVFANCFAIVADKFYAYNQVGLGTGVINIAFAGGTILGPVIGGATTQSAWYWVFFFNVPFGLLGTIIGFLYVKDHIPPNARHTPVWQVLKRFDFVGCVSLVVAIALLFVVVVSSLFPSSLSTPPALGAMGSIAGLAIITFFIQEGFIRGGKRRSRDRPAFVNFSLFKSWVYVNTIVIGGFGGGIARTNLTFAMIFFFQGPYKQNPLLAGVMLIPFGLGVMLGGLPSGVLADMFGYRYLCTIGLIIASAGSIAMPLAIQPDSNFWAIAGMIFTVGLGWGLYNSPSGSISMLCVKPSQRAASSSLRLMFTMLAQMVSIVLVFDLIVGSLPFEAVVQLFIIGGGIDQIYVDSFMSGWRLVMWVSTAITVLAGIAAIGLPVKPVLAQEESD